MIEIQTRGKGTIDHGLQGSMGTLANANPTKLSKQSQGCPLTGSPIGFEWLGMYHMRDLGGS